MYARAIEAVVVGAHEHVVDVEQDAAVGAAGELGEELVLRHVGVAEAQVARRVLEQDAPAEALLHRLHASDDVRERLLGVRHRQQIVRVDAVGGAPAEVVGDPGRLDVARERGQLRQVALVERIGRADRQRHAVQHHRVVAADRLQHAARVAARDHEVLGDHLEPADVRLGFDDVAVVLAPQTQAASEVGEHVGSTPLGASGYTDERPDKNDSGGAGGLCPLTSGRRRLVRIT